MSLHITKDICLADEEIQISQIRAQGPGGQNVNKVASAIHLRFAIRDSSLPLEVQNRLLTRSYQRITDQGDIVIKASRYRTREQNLEDAKNRLAELIREALHTPKKRRPTRASRASKTRRLESKTKRSRTKQMRKKITGE